MFWYALQIVIIVYVVQLYTNELAPNANWGHICLFAIGIAYGVTWLCVKALDLLLRLKRRVSRQHPEQLLSVALRSRPRKKPLVAKVSLHRLT